MPELPEVEACRRLAERYCTGKLIETAQVADDAIVIEGIEPAKLQEALQGRTVKAAQRKGKHMWIDFDSGPSLMLHFGMTGSLVVKGIKSHQYRSFKVNGSDWPPKYWKVLLNLEGDVSMAFSDSRRFARVRLQQDPAQHEPVSLLGFDPVLSMPSLADFTALIAKQKRSLKALLLDQAFSAGVGNWVADEVLFHAKLYPEVKANSLTEEEVQRLHEAIRKVPEAAVEAEADSEKFPADWLFHVRWDGKKKNPKIAGNAVEFLKVGGRTTAYVPAVQKAPPGAAASQAKGTSKGTSKSKGKRKADSYTGTGEEDSSDNEAEQKIEPAKSRGQPPQKRNKKGKEANQAPGNTGKGKAKGGRGAGRQAEEEEQAQSEAMEEEDNRKDVKAKSVKARKAAVSKKKTAGKQGDEEEEEAEEGAEQAEAGPSKPEKGKGKPKAAVTKRQKKKAKDDSDEEEPALQEEVQGQEPTVKGTSKGRSKGRKAAVKVEEDEGSEEVGDSPKPKGRGSTKRKKAT